MTPDVRRRLTAAHALLKDLELSSDEFVRDEETLAKLMALLGTFGGEPWIEVSKLAGLVVHLKAGMKTETLSHLLVPLERALGKNVRDDDFVVTDRDDFAAPADRLPLRFVLDNVRSAFNVGSILRTADGLGVETVHLCGYTTTPENEKTARAALGAEQAVTWRSEPEITALLKRLKNEGYRLIALETARGALDLPAPFPAEPAAFVLGNERFGLGPEVLSLCDEVRRVPLQGAKNSLNVGVIAALAAYEWRNQWRR